MSKHEILINTILMVWANVVSRMLNDIIDEMKKLPQMNFTDFHELAVLMIIILYVIGIYLLP
ncbi:MAG: hypothetical protein HDS71_08890 [Bacteroidales bacterium]|nr:hypothetical protein [Bacteroidales bacterium]